MFCNMNTSKFVRMLHCTEAVQKLETEKLTYGGDHEETQNQSENFNDVLGNIFRTHKSHPSILKIKENIQIEEKMLQKMKFTLKVI